MYNMSTKWEINETLPCVCVNDWLLNCICCLLLLWCLWLFARSYVIIEPFKAMPKATQKFLFILVCWWRILFSSSSSKLNTTKTQRNKWTGRQTKWVLTLFNVASKSLVQRQSSEDWKRRKLVQNCAGKVGCFRQLYPPKTQKWPAKTANKTKRKDICWKLK